LTALNATFSPSTKRTELIFMSNLPPRAIRLFDCASVTVAHATPPLGIMSKLLSLTSSSTSKSTVSPTCASAEDTVRPILSLTGCHKFRTKVFSALQPPTNCTPPDRGKQAEPLSCGSDRKGRSLIVKHTSGRSDSFIVKPEKGLLRGMFVLKIEQGMRKHRCVPR